MVQGHQPPVLACEAAGATIDEQIHSGALGRESAQWEDGREREGKQCVHCGEMWSWEQAKMRSLCPPQPVVMSWGHVATGGHTELSRLCCHLRPW